MSDVTNRGHMGLTAFNRARRLAAEQEAAQIAAQFVAPAPDKPTEKRMSDTVVARLRERIETERDAQGLGIGLDAVAVGLADLAALLDVVERFAAVEPFIPTLAYERDVECLYCEELGDFVNPRFGGGVDMTHAPDCVWKRARELCGMDGDA